MALALPKWDWLPVGRVTPSSSISGIIQLGGRLQIKSWALNHLRAKS